MGLENVTSSSSGQFLMFILLVITKAQYLNNLAGHPKILLWYSIMIVIINKYLNVRNYQANWQGVNMVISSVLMGTCSWLERRTTTQRKSSRGSRLEIFLSESRPPSKPNSNCWSHSSTSTLYLLEIPILIPMATSTLLWLTARAETYISSLRKSKVKNSRRRK